MHPRERRTSRRRFLIDAGGATVALSGADALLRAADALGSLGGGAPIGPGGIPLARRNHPVKLPLYSDNPPIASGKSPEKGPLEVFNWSAYINPAVVKAFAKQYGVQVNVTTFENEEEALSKLTSGSKFDIWVATVDYLSRAVAGKLIQPLELSYVPNLKKNVWPSLRSPFYDVGSRYSVPYTIYTTGITWRNDKIKKGPTAYANPWDIFWHAAQYKGKVAILDDQREALTMALQRRHVADVNTENAKLVQRAHDDLSQLTKLVNVKTNTTDYQDVPAGSTWLSQAWSGDMAAAANYMPKGVPVTTVSYWRPDTGAVIGNDMITILRGAKNPVLAHHLLDYLLDTKHALQNLSWLGYMQPLTGVKADRVVADGYIPKNLASTVVAESDFKSGVSLLPLTVAGQTVWQDAWSKFKAGG